MADSSRLHWARHYYDGLRLHEQGEYIAAEGELRTAVRLAQRLRPVTSQNDDSIGSSLTALARLEDARHRDAEARRLYRRAIAVEERALGADHPYVAIVLRGYAHLLARMGRRAQSERAQRRADAIWDKGYGLHASHFDEWSPGAA